MSIFDPGIPDCNKSDTIHLGWYILGLFVIVSIIVGCIFTSTSFPIEKTYTLHSMDTEAQNSEPFVYEIHDSGLSAYYSVYVQDTDGTYTLTELPKKNTDLRIGCETPILIIKETRTHEIQSTELCVPSNAIQKEK